MKDVPSLLVSCLLCQGSHSDSPLSGVHDRRHRDLHPIEYVRAGRTQKKDRALLLCPFNCMTTLYDNFRIRELQFKTNRCDCLY